MHLVTSSSFLRCGCRFSPTFCLRDFGLSPGFLMNSVCVIVLAFVCLCAYRYTPVCMCVCGGQRTSLKVTGSLLAWNSPVCPGWQWAPRIRCPHLCVPGIHAQLFLCHLGVLNWGSRTCKAITLSSRLSLVPITVLMLSLSSLWLKVTQLEPELQTKIRTPCYVTQSG